MTYTEIQQALERKMTQWPGNVPIWFDGTQIPPLVKQSRENDPRSPWIRFVIITSKAFTASIGQSPCRRVPGIITAEIYYPLRSIRIDPETGQKKGINPALECSRLADSLVAHFQYWQDVKLSTQATSNVYVKEQKDEYGDWYRRNVVTDFDAD